MNYKLLIITLFSVVVFASCKSAYKNMQTPDDLYYSPASGIEDDNVRENNTARSNNNNDRFLRYKVRNRYLWGCIDDYSYWNDIRYNNCNCYDGYYNWNTPYLNNVWSWQGYHSPYYFMTPYANTNIKTGNSINTKITSYNNTNFNNNNTKQVKSSNNISLPSFNPFRIFNSGSTPSSNAGGNSGGFNSKGSSTEKPRTGRP
ncbi:MAG: hypothetical protein KGZ59_00790 [Chitinophagaceae bacterium]|nr:hypothetical protein [Chitinophagaceae bacterium]